MKVSLGIGQLLHTGKAVVWWSLKQIIAMSSVNANTQMPQMVKAILFEY